jgi:hypothetical protein
MSRTHRNDRVKKRTRSRSGSPDANVGTSLSRPAAPFPEMPKQNSWRFPSAFWASLGLILLAIVAYLPALGAGFVWDDTALTDNFNSCAPPGGFGKSGPNPGPIPNSRPIIGRWSIRPIGSNGASGVARRWATISSMF